MLKKKDQLLQTLKKDQDYHLTEYLNNSDLLQLALTSKRYYLALVPHLQTQQLDLQATLGTHNLKKKVKKTQKQSPLLSEVQTQVEIEKVPLHKFRKYKKLNDSWVKIDQLDFHNDYLNKKIQNRTSVFYRNSDSGEVIFVNRSMVDPSLNYNKGGFGESFLSNQIYGHYYEEGEAMQDLSSMEAILKRQKQLLAKTNLKKEEQAKSQVINFQDQLERALNTKRFAIILCFGGSFSFGIFEGGRCVLHKSDKKYVCRKKAGERQLNRDKQSGSQIQSMGSQIRRDQEKKHVINVGEILRENHKDLSECQVLFLQAPGLNRLFVINQNQNLDGLQNRLRSVCVTAKKANFTQIEALYESISQVNIVRVPGSKQVKSRQGKKKKEQ